MAHESRFAFAPLVIVLLVMALALALGAATAFADDSMSGMPGMSAQDMQNMATPTPAATAMGGGSMPATSAPQTGALGRAMDPNMDMGGGSVNWAVIGGFVALVVGSTLAAVATKRYLAGRMAAGELAGAEALDV